jgi:hypothetical protein
MVRDFKEAFQKFRNLDGKWPGRGSVLVRAHTYALLIPPTLASPAERTLWPSMVGELNGSLLANWSTNLAAVKVFVAECV